MSVLEIPYLIGILGLAIYTCLIVVRHTRFAGLLVEKSKKYENVVRALESNVDEFKAQKQEKIPQLDELMRKVLALREKRDQLLQKYGEIENGLAKSKSFLPKKITNSVER